MRISDWSSDVCSSDLPCVTPFEAPVHMRSRRTPGPPHRAEPLALHDAVAEFHVEALAMEKGARQSHAVIDDQQIALQREGRRRRSEEHTSELQSLMRISYAVFCLKTKNNKPRNIHTQQQDTS